MTFSKSEVNLTPYGHIKFKFKHFIRFSTTLILQIFINYNGVQSLTFTGLISILSKDIYFRLNLTNP